MQKQEYLDCILWCDQLAVLIGNGVPILEALSIVGESVPRYKKATQYIHDQVWNGDSIYGAMKPQSEFPGLVKVLCDIGEETGDLDHTLEAAANLLEMELRAGQDPDGMNRIVFYKAFATLQQAGLPILRTVKVLGQHTDYLPPDVVEAVASNIENGSTLSEAMATQPQHFNRVALNLIAAGEAGGCLDKTLDMYVKHLQREYELRKVATEPQ